MISVLYCNISDADPGKFSKDSLLLDKQKKRARGITGDLMMYEALKQSGGSSFFPDHYRLNKFGKPFIDGWFYFNRSYAEEMTAFVYADQPVGIDIAFTGSITDKNISLSFFHPEEQAYIHNANNRPEAICTLWVKKEALLKARGTGLVDHLENINCTGESTFYKGQEWYFYPVSLYEGYTCYICSAIADEVPQVKKFSIHG